ncbi:hypothetical protein HPB50_007298 [Hyalomma asiaticum]|uniref:Uncharacterized protein n=1 Tax=Hyalomma asiaticum TaxID=266040 RepID=A0ACB7RI67_HYAAI|nr:hypothetical protein HPB50_007298 [Hyalomma asiaticum]
MNSPIPRRRRLVHGFGSHLEMRTVEFVEELEDWHHCSWCDAVSSEICALPCRHVLCDMCIAKYRKYDHTGNFTIYCCECVSRKWPKQDANAGDKQVRCVNAGCDFVGRLRDLNEHLQQSCVRYLTACSKCDEALAYMDKRNHYVACRGRMGTFVSAADAGSLLHNLDVAFKELEQALDSATLEDRDALQNTVALVSEQLARVRDQLDAGVSSYVKLSGLLRLSK